ncbi:FixH family protein [Bacillus sp. EB600]|uniref:FixH family protein n=1 Tax=Bacillus sp. EB600 TaxID=2806345 RepID=UPI00210E3B93|nr:FixH family protein [Bacillus sp. EB600]MCQ6280312.1 FixH family protein [Bacillus sp. EB600]
MKKSILLVLLLMAAMLAGCSSGPDYKVDVTKPLYFVKDKAAPFEIKVTEKGKAIKGLTVTAEMEMANMDHGTETAKLKESDSGHYSGKSKLPMDGKYKITFTMTKAKVKSETTIDYTVKKAQGLATINGKWITKDDLDFYQFVNKLQLEINRVTAKQKYKGDVLKDELTNIDTQEKAAADQNQLLTQIIRIRAMALLAEEKGHNATPADIQAAIAKDRAQYNEYPEAKQLIQQFGETKFSALAEKEYKYAVLANQVEADVIARTKAENPKVNDQEINYQAQQNYEDLLVSQMSSLKIEVF